MSRPPAGLIMRLGAVLLGAVGLPLLFAPAEMAAAFGWAGQEPLTSLAAGGLLAVAVLDWTGRGAVYGGIFGRPIILANLVLALTAGLPILKAQIRSPDATLLGWLPAGILAAHGLAFAWLLLSRRDPKPPA